jgi:transposase
VIHAAEQDRPDVAQRRAAWRVEQLSMDPQKVVFIDETWAKTNMTRLRGRARRGHRLTAKIPYGHWKTTTLIGALDYAGIRCSMTVDGAINADIFEAFLEQVLLPTLRVGEVVVMDNLSSHKSCRVRELIESVGAELLYLPPYSPDLNPIELAFSKIKQRLRTQAYRTVDSLWKCMQEVLDTISQKDAVNFLKHCGYTLHLN